jgi:hypothetical protein
VENYEQETVELKEAELPEPEESLVDRLRKQRQAVAENKFTDLDIPGYNGDLFCRYRLLDGTELDQIIRKVRRTVKDRSEQVMAATLDNIITACEELWVRDNGKERPVRDLSTVPTDLPVKYDVILAEFLGFSAELPDPPTARSVVLGVFGGNDIAVSAHGARLAQWMMQSGAEVDELLGEL